MEKAVEDMNLLQVLLYLDDLIVFGATLEEHEERLLKVFDRLEEVGLKVFWTSVRSADLVSNTWVI